ncbi:MAG: PhoH family protein [Desulfovibrionaceae bacterium]
MAEGKSKKAQRAGKPGGQAGNQVGKQAGTAAGTASGAAAGTASGAAAGAGVERTLSFDDQALACTLFGPCNDTLLRLAGRSGVDVQSRGNEVVLRAADDAAIAPVAEALIQSYGLLKQGQPVFARDVERAYGVLAHDPGADVRKMFTDNVFVVSPKKAVAPKSVTQREYVRAMRELDMVFGIGPAGTGKTYLAVAMALHFLTQRRVKRIVLTRPAVEAGERLGFLPGDMVEKVNPYLRPLYDALHDMMDFGKVTEMLETGVIEIAPLAFMRGRTLNDAFIILDEAQNTTPEQMKMFLTRLGFGSRAVVTGDVTQIDLPREAVRGGRRDGGAPRSGLVQVMNILDGVEGVRFVRFMEADVIRHPLVGRIVQAYEAFEASGKGAGDKA